MSDDEKAPRQPKDPSAAAKGHPASGEYDVPNSREYHVPDESPWARAWKVAAVVGALGVACAIAGYAIDPRRFAFAYLMGFLTVLTMALGSTFFVLIQHLTGAGWSVTVRRASEFFVAGAIIIPCWRFPTCSAWASSIPGGSGHQEHGHEEHGHGVSVAHAAGARRGARDADEPGAARSGRRARARVSTAPSTRGTRPRSRRSSATSTRRSSSSAP